MSLNAGLTTLREDEIARHVAAAQALVTRFALIEADGAPSSAPIAGTGRRFVPTVSTAGVRRTRDVELTATVQAVHAADPLLSPAGHMLVYRTRRGAQVALAVADVFARQTVLEGLQARNLAAPLAGADAVQFKAYLAAAGFVAAFTLTAYLQATLPPEEGEGIDVNAPDFLFETPQDGLKSIVAGLARAISGSADDKAMAARARAYLALTQEELLARKSRFPESAAFETMHIRLDADDVTLNGFEAGTGIKSKPLAMSFKKPEEIVGNHIAKYQAMKLARMLVAYDFDRQMNPFVELGGFIFTFMGDGMPGTGKTILIQMIAGLLNDYCQVAGYGFHYENFGVDQISSYQGKSGQNCKAFVNAVTNPRAIGFGTIDDVDQVAAKRSDDRASAGQQEVTAVLMESFAGASTVVRGNCTFGMFSNHPEAVDDALRQRAGARWLIDGPQTRDDYIDIFALLIGRNHAIPLGDHTLYAGQSIKTAVKASYDGHSRPSESGLAAVWERFESENGGIKSLTDIGNYLYRIKEVEPRFTGRAIKNITDAIKMRAMDIDLPDEWFSNPEPFLHKSYDEKKQMIEALRTPITLDMVLQEINRYADSEFRYSDTSDRTAIDEIVRREKQRERALSEIEALKRDGKW